MSPGLSVDPDAHYFGFDLAPLVDCVRDLRNWGWGGGAGPILALPRNHRIMYMPFAICFHGFVLYMLIDLMLHGKSDRIGT